MQICPVMQFFLLKENENLQDALPAEESMTVRLFVPRDPAKVEGYRTITKVPMPMRIHPISDFAVNSSCRNVKARINVMTTLRLSMGTTFEASPICNA